MIKVKVCGLSEPMNVREIVEADPDFIGFIFYPLSPRYVGEETGTDIFKNIPAGIKKAGVFINETSNKILEIAGRANLDMIQLHGDETADICSGLKSSGLEVIKTFSIDMDFCFETLTQYVPVCDYFLFDTKSDKAGGSGRKFDWKKLDEYSFDKPFFLSGGIGPEDTGKIRTMRNRGLFAVDINSRFETAPGIKDAGLVSKFIKELKMIGYDI
jgi:phosphoribosylanthranilate isomerase